MDFVVNDVTKPGISIKGNVTQGVDESALGVIHELLSPLSSVVQVVCLVLMAGQDEVGIRDFVLLDEISMPKFLDNLKKRYFVDRKVCYKPLTLSNLWVHLGSCLIHNGIL